MRRRVAEGLLAAALLIAPACALAADWRDALAARIERLDRDTPGALGVFVERLDGGERYAHEADRAWYLSSAAKVPIAIAVLQDVDAGRLRLADTLRLEADDRVDGVGELTWARVGTAVTIDSLLDRMLGPSDSTAANMLIRAVGIERINRSAQSAFGGRGLGRLTDFAQVRRDVYAELHPDARRITNEQMVRLAGIHPDARRVDALRAMLGIEAGALRARTLADAHDRYYRRGLNSATLEAYGGMLARLVRGELLSPASTARLFAAMKLGRRGTAHRLEAGVPASRRMIHKTGTQYRRACHMAVIDPEQGGRAATVVATCVADLDQGAPADAALAQVGRAIAQALGPAPRR